MDTPPPLPKSPPQLPASVCPASSFPSQAATFSLIAPLIAIGISIALQPQVRGNRWAMMILGATSMLLIVLGLVFGIVALVGARRHGRQGIFGKAMTGTCVCGILTLLILISLPGLMRAAQRAKAMQRQRMEQSPEKVVDRVRAEVATILKKDSAQIDVTKSLVDQGADELDLVEIVMAVEEAFKVEIPDSAIGENFNEAGKTLTVVKLAEIVSTRR